MANFHLDLKIHSKKMENGGTKSISSIVAYRHCFAMGDYDFTNKRKQLIDAFLMFPNTVSRVDAQNLLNAPVSRDLWLSSERMEKRKDAQLCREMILSLQHELSLEENINNLKTLINKHFTSKGLFADVCIHNSGNNLHAHVLLTQRELLNCYSFFNPLTNEHNAIFEFGKKIREEQFYKNGQKVNEITQLREDWANLCNASFKNNGLDIEISDKTLKVQREIALEKGNFELAATLDREPVKHFSMAKMLKAVESATGKLADKIKNTQGNKQKMSMFLESRKNNRQKTIARKLKEFLDEYTTIKNRIIANAPKLAKARAGATKLIADIGRDFRNRQNRISADAIARNQQQTAQNADRIAEHRKRDELDFSDIPHDNEQSQDQNFNKVLATEIDSKLKNKNRMLWFDPNAKYTPFK